MSRLEELIIKINITNSSTKLDGLTITEYIAKRDVLLPIVSYQVRVVLGKIYTCDGKTLK